MNQTIQWNKQIFIVYGVTLYFDASISYLENESDGIFADFFFTSNNFFFVNKNFCSLLYDLIKFERFLQ